MWHTITGRTEERTPYDGTGITAPCADGRHSGCQDPNCACPAGTCTHARATRKSTS
ncbi:hypothetical protein ABT352_32765 [Streptosporangium sp. NPDC000563]|uniref:hypothetical protein n=1 Tax=Streptosporangium sp. NPDC000563 TaxID=3154366 RepID=UPI00331BC4C0